MKLQKITRFYVLTVLVLSLFINCSSVKLISDYDEVTDKTVTQMQRNVANYFVVLERTIGTDKANYEEYIPFFDNAKVDLNILEVRAGALDKNEIVQKQVTELQTMIKNLEELHKLGFTSPEVLQPLKQPFNAAFSAIIKLQMALKRGKEQTK